MYKETCHKHPFHLKEMSLQGKSNSMKTRCLVVLHLWNNGQRSSAAISRITKTPLNNKRCKSLWKKCSVLLLTNTHMFI